MSTHSDPMDTSTESTVETPPSPTPTVADYVDDDPESPLWIKPFDFNNFQFRWDATTVMQLIIKNEKLPDEAVEAVCANEGNVEPDVAEIIEKDIIEAIDMGGLWLLQTRFNDLACLYIDSPYWHPRELWATRFADWGTYYLERLPQEKIRRYFGAICTAIQSVYIRVQQKADPQIIQDILGQSGPQNFPTQYQRDHFPKSLYPGWDQYDPDGEGRVNPVPDCTTTAG